MSIFLETFINIGNVTRRNLHLKVIRQEKTGKDVVIAFDESKRMIALYACAKVCTRKVSFESAELCIPRHSFTYLCSMRFFPRYNPGRIQ